MRLLHLLEALTVGCLDCLLMSAGSGAETADVMHVHLTTMVLGVIQACSLFFFFFPKFVKDLCYSLKKI